MRVILNENCDGFNLIPENMAERAYIRTFWNNKTKNYKEGNKTFKAVVFAHLIDENDGVNKTGKAPFQLHINTHGWSSCAAEWEPR